MSKDARTTSPTGGQTTEQARECDRCGRDRPASTRRFTVTASDLTGATADYEQVLLDDIRHEVSRPADAVERQNDLLEAEQSAPQVGR